MPETALARLPDLIEPIVTVQCCRSSAVAVQTALEYISIAESTSTQNSAIPPQISEIRKQVRIAAQLVNAVLHDTEKILERAFRLGVRDFPKENKLDLKEHVETIKMQLDRFHSLRECTEHSERIINEWRFHLESCQEYMKTVGNFFEDELSAFLPKDSTSVPDWFHPIKRLTDKHIAQVDKTVFSIKTALSALGRLSTATHQVNSRPEVSS